MSADPTEIGGGGVAALGALAGSIVAPIVITVVTLIQLPPESAFALLPAIAPLAWLIALLIAMTLGMGWHAIAYAHGITGVRSYLLVGAAIPVALGLIIDVTLGTLDEIYRLPGHRLMFAIVALIGAANAGVAWAVRRPDKD